MPKPAPSLVWSSHAGRRHAYERTSDVRQRTSAWQVMLGDMGYPRNKTVDENAPGFYHCVSRCVRQARLCGRDPVSGRDYEHRRAWVEARLKDLAESFAVGLYAWAVMSNHTHVVLRVDPRAHRHWTDEEVAFRWARLSRGLEPVPDEKLRIRMRTLLDDPEHLRKIRCRLGNLSWFMRYLNESIARAANAEDGCTGRFWEGRFRCQALLDESAVALCMAYVDLNPIRAGLADELLESRFTSIRERLLRLAKGTSRGDDRLDAVIGVPDAGGPAISLAAYIKLVDWTGRNLHKPDAASIEASAPPALARIESTPAWWFRHAPAVESGFGRAVGADETLARRGIRRRRL